MWVKKGAARIKEIKIKLLFSHFKLIIFKKQKWYALKKGHYVIYMLFVVNLAKRTGTGEAKSAPSGVR